MHQDAVGCFAPLSRLFSGFGLLPAVASRVKTCFPRIFSLPSPPFWAFCVRPGTDCVVLGDVLCRSFVFRPFVSVLVTSFNPRTQYDALCRVEAVFDATLSPCHACVKFFLGSSGSSAFFGFLAATAFFHRGAGLLIKEQLGLTHGRAPLADF